MESQSIENSLGTFKLTEGNSVVLDLIRGLSAQLVVVGHGIGYCGILTFLHQPNFPWMQNIAVLIFFLLSGFLITYSTLRKKLRQKKYSFTQFFIDRFSRIYTAFIPALLFVLALDLLSRYISPDAYQFTRFFNVKTFVGNVFMLQDFPFFKFVIPQLAVNSFGSARPFWTLAVEWWIYLFFGYLMLVFLQEHKLKIKNLVILAGLSIAPFYNLIGGRGNGLMMYWVFGAIVYLVISHNILKNIRTSHKFLFLMVLLGAAVIRIALTMEEYEPIFGFILAMILLLIIDLFKNTNFSKRAIKVIRFIASYSYTLYLIHYSILDFMVIHFKESMNPYLLFILAFIISNILSGIIGYYSEIILTKKLKTWMYRYKGIDQSLKLQAQTK